jgi:cell division protein FtsA
MFGIGGRAYTRAVERDMNVTFEEAEEMKLELSTNQVPRSKAPAIEAALRKTLEVWTSGVELALGDFDKLDHLPYRIFLCGGGSSLDMIVDELQESNWYRSLPFTRRPVVRRIRPEQVVGIADLTEKVTDHTFITAMGLLRVGVDTLQFSGSSSKSIRAKIDRMLQV